MALLIYIFIFIMINDIGFLYGFIYESANLINNLYDYENYDHLVIKLCSEFVMRIMNICCERCFKLSQDEYLETKKFIDNNMDIIESVFAPMIISSIIEVSVVAISCIFLFLCCDCFS